MAAPRQEFPIEQQLRKDIQDAQRARDQVRLDTLRMALGAIHNLEVARTDRKNPEYGQPLNRSRLRKGVGAGGEEAQPGDSDFTSRVVVMTWSTRNSTRWSYCRTIYRVRN